MTPLAYLRHVFEVTGDPRVPVWPKRWRERAERIAEDDEDRISMLEYELAKAKGTAGKPLTIAQVEVRRAEALASAPDCGVSTGAYTSRKRDA